MTGTSFDVIVLGADPGGYLAAERLEHAGKKVVLTEEQYLGGTCLNVGCIPTKTLLTSAENYLHAKGATVFSVSVEGLALGWDRLQDWKNTIVKSLVSGVAATEERAGVTVVEGRGRFGVPGKVSVSDVQYIAEHVIIATGSMPAVPPIPGVRGNPVVVGSTGILSLPEVSKRFAVVGGGVIDVEFASLYSTLGFGVTVIEMTPEILPFMGDNAAARMRTAMKGVAFELGCRVKSLEGTTTHYSKGEEKKSLEADVILMTVRRRSAAQDWGDEEAGLEINHGIVVDGCICTNLPNIWVIGDITGRSLLARTAYRMGEIVTMSILDPQASKRGKIMRQNTVPWAIFLIPEAAGVGLTESVAKREGRDVLVAKVLAQMSGRFAVGNGFKATEETKILVDLKTRQVLGIHVLGAYAAEMVWGTRATPEMELTVEDFRQVVFPHPTVSGVIRKAVWVVKLRISDLSSRKKQDND